MNDPTPIHELKGASIPWDKVNPEEYRVIRAIAERAYAMYQEWIAKRRLTLKPGETILEPDVMVIMMDITCAHISRGLDLHALMMADDLSFISDILSIQTNIQRVDGVLPAFVHLRFTRQTA